jgi:hypothetical protein
MGDIILSIHNQSLFPDFEDQLRFLVIKILGGDFKQLGRMIAPHWAMWRPCPTPCWVRDATVPNSMLGYDVSVPDHSWVWSQDESNSS